ncbi:MAG: hypothetical protein R3E93_08750 [Thiothrix sp.]
MEISKGENAQIINLLYSQAVSLDAMFVDLAARAAISSEVEYFEAAKIYMQFALKAQTRAVQHCRPWVKSLNPKTVTIARQANSNRSSITAALSKAVQAGKTAKFLLRARRKFELDKTNYWAGCNMTGWTLERRQWQAELIKTWKPGKVHRGKNRGRQKNAVARMP